MVMDGLQTCFKDQVIGIQAAIHNCHATKEVEQVITSGSTIIYSNDKAELEFKNTSYNIWNAAGSYLDMANIVLNAKMNIKLAGMMKAGTANAKLQVELIIPVLDIVCSTKTFVIPDVGAWHTDFVTFHPYNGVDPKANNFHVKLTALDGDITIKNTTILIEV